MTETANATRPYLGALTEPMQIRALVAETQGWQVRITDDDDTPWFEAGYLVGLPPDWRQRDPGFFRELLDDDEGPPTPEVEDWTWLPDYLSDPAAWGALIERERLVVKPWDARRWGSTARGSGRWSIAEAPGRAVCLAVLAKYGIAWPA